MIKRIACIDEADYFTVYNEGGTLVATRIPTEVQAIVIDNAPELLEILNNMTEIFNHVVTRCDDGWVTSTELDILAEAYELLERIDNG